MTDRATGVRAPTQEAMTARAIGLALALAAGGLACNGRHHAAQTSDANPDTNTTEAASERYEVDLFAFGRQLGTIAPCGCTTEPLGGLQFAFGYIEAESEAGQRLVLEPGSFLYPDPEGPEAPTDEAAWAQARQRAQLLHRRFAASEGLVSGLGPTDYAASESAKALETFPLPRVAANLAADARPAGVERVRTVSLGRGLTAGVTQVIDPALVDASRTWASAFPAVTEPIAALGSLGDAFTSASLQVVMVHGPRELAEAAARVEGVDVVIIGGEFSNPDRARLGGSAVQVGSAWVLEPGDRGQTISHLTLSVADAGGELPPPSEWTLIPSREQTQAQLDRVEDKLAKFRADPSADARFIANLERERDELAAQLDAPAIGDDVPAAVIHAQTKVTCKLDTDAAAKQALADYDRAVATTNRERFAGVKAPAPEPGQPGYVGMDACEACHEEAVAMWKTTVHARAYETLVTANKQYDLSCVNCHVTGFREPGGSEVVENQHLQSVQCEQCHGPGSLHVDDPPNHIRRLAPQDICLGCHTPDHSDTFDYGPYLRDVLGEGHGGEARAGLGDGPTAHELRAAALEQVGGACGKM